MSTEHCFCGAPRTPYAALGSYKQYYDFKVYETVSDPAKLNGQIIFFPDGFGLAKHNLQLADSYAANGYTTTTLDYFEGDALPECFMGYVPGTDVELYEHLTPQEKDIVRSIDMPAWQQRHSPERLKMIVNGFMDQFHLFLRQSQTLHVIGHCFGGKYALIQANQASLTSAIAVHPSFLEEADMNNPRCPVFIGCAETDMFTPSLIPDVFSSLRKSRVSYKCAVYGGTKHGFASRPETEDIVAQRAYHSCFKDTLTWMDEAEAGHAISDRKRRSIDR